jgi:glutathione S-transferase
MIYPTPHGGKRFRPKVAKLGGRQQFPFLVDPNSGESLFESAAIREYLLDKYAR